MIEKRGGGVLGATLSLATLLIAVFGAAVGYLEYRDAQQRERIERVFRYSDMLAQQADAAGKIAELGDAFVTDWKTIVLSAGPEATAEEIKEATRKWYSERMAYDPSFRDAFDRMSLFYDTLAVCISQGLCDEPTAKALFTQHVAGFASTVYPWVSYRSEEYFSAAGTQAICLRNRFCGGEPVCTGLPDKMADCQ